MANDVVSTSSVSSSYVALLVKGMLLMRRRLCTARYRASPVVQPAQQMICDPPTNGVSKNSHSTVTQIRGFSVKTALTQMSSGPHTDRPALTQTGSPSHRWARGMSVSGVHSWSPRRTTQEPAVHTGPAQRSTFRIHPSAVDSAVGVGRTGPLVHTGLLHRSGRPTQDRRSRPTKDR